MNEQVAISVEQRLGVIALDRPEAINALSLAMIERITAALEGWAGDAAVAAVLFEGRGPRGFCAGGDVRAVRELVIAGRKAEADAYFAAEYRLNGRIATYGKPVIALTHGAVMGGGIGIAGHAAFRLTTPEARFAMPEAAIGFIVDTGVNAILAKAPEHRALAFLLSGLTVGAADALTLGLTDGVIAAEARERVRAGLVAASATPDVETAIVSLMQSEAVDAGEAGLCAEADRQVGIFGLASAGEIVAALGSEAEPLGRALAQRSPTSLEAILMSHRAARQAQGIAEVLAIDLAFARYMIGLPDFAEGVRAVLVDKDRAPKWQPATVAEVDRAALAAVLGVA